MADAPELEYYRIPDAGGVCAGVSSFRGRGGEPAWERGAVGRGAGSGSAGESAGNGGKYPRNDRGEYDRVEKGVCAMSEINVEEVVGKLLEEMALITGKPVGELDRSRSLAQNGINSMGFVELLLTVAKNWNVNLMDAGIGVADVRSVESLAERIARERMQ